MSRMRSPTLGFLPGVFCLLAFILILLLLLAGVNNSLTSIYFLKTDASKLSVPSKLADSTFLKDLSAVSGADYVGQPATASSLGIADSYTISLLTACGHFADGTVSCAKPSIGFAFNPGADLRLDGTSLQGSYSDAFLKALSTYSKLTRWLAGSYVASALFLFLAPIAACASALGGAFVSAIATLVLFAASVAGAVIFKNVNAAFNDNFSASGAGLSSSIGVTPVALSFVAFVFSLIASVLFFLTARRNSKSSRRGPSLAHAVGGKGSPSLLAEDPYAAPTGDTTDKKKKSGGFLTNLTSPITAGLNKHKYMQVGAQPALVRTDVQGQRRSVSADDAERRRLDDDWAAQDDYSHGGNGQRSRSRSRSPAPVASAAGAGGGASVPLVTLGGIGNKPTRDMNTAYEPYSSGPRE
ncbi:SUR7/PalI family-domain-containing protein [Apodospora peruviana]|uniref:SUR7/PalI family-domain-containing protein n=1 Tax=Apodospora peruviana TaxID=516989 RepID=A0AAE0M4L3_9PEZI|nr:SUR7/PalI family-domain-containing protein [Apodospora peruviana]